MQNSSFDERRQFIIKLGKALHKFGTPAYRLESHLHNMADWLGLHAQFLIAPTSLTFTIESEDQKHETSHIMRVKPGEIDLSALARTDELVHDLADGKVSLRDAEKELERIIAQKPIYSSWINFFAFGIISSAFALILQSSWHNIACSGLLGFFVYGLTYLATDSKRITKMLEPLAAITTAFIATIISSFYPEINASFCTLAAIIVFIPGLSLTLGLSEIAERDLIAGTARVMDSCMTLFKLYFGAQLGLILATLFISVPNQMASAPHSDIAYIGVPLLSLGLGVIFNTRPKDIIWGLGVALIAYEATIISRDTLGDNFAPFIGALTVGVLANLYSSFMKAPASIALLQGLIILVPGSKTYINLNKQVAGEDILLNSSMGQETFMAFMAIVAGLTFANLFVPPKRSL